MISVQCWGTRGSIPSPGPDTIRYGGNTSCVEIRIGGRQLLFDAGTGIHHVGRDLRNRNRTCSADIFLTHFHWDHIQGFPFFYPLYDPHASLRIYGPDQEEMDIETIFANQMSSIHFPLPFEAVAATCLFEHLNDEVWHENGIVVSPMRMRHSAHTVGYRIESEGKRICYIPDNELAGEDYPVPATWREDFAEFVQEADLLLHDAMFTDEEYEKRRGWGHSTFRQTFELALETDVRRLLFFHHAPYRTDDRLDEIARSFQEQARTRGSELEIGCATENLEIVIE